MLCGPHPNSTATDPKFALNWYQVVTIDKDGMGIQGFDAEKQRVVALRGPQWPWQPASNWNNYSQPSNNLCVAICRGAVAVHTKTMRLESPKGSSSFTFGGGGSTNTTPPGYTFN
jgi:hypothetical protein